MHYRYLYVDGGKGLVFFRSRDIKLGDLVKPYHYSQNSPINSVR